MFRLFQQVIRDLSKFQKQVIVDELWKTYPKGYNDPPKVISLVLAIELEESAPDADLANKDNIMLL